MISNSKTAQQFFEEMMRGYVTPAMNEIGYRGNFRKFSRREGQLLATVVLQKSRGNSKDCVEFTYNLRVIDIPTGRGIWSCRLGNLLPAMLDSWWLVTSPISESNNLAVLGSDMAIRVKPNGEEIINSLRVYGNLAIDEVFVSPWKPIDPTLEPEVADLSVLLIEFADQRANSPTGPESQSWPDGELIERLSEDRSLARRLALEQIRRRPQTWDSATIEAVKNSLRNDSNPIVREEAARVLGQISPNDLLGDALEIAAENDQDPQVRWSARYASALRKEGL